MAKKSFELSGGVWREKRKMHTGMGRKLALVVVIGAIAFAVSRPTPTVPVMLVKAERRNFDLWVKGVGNVQASQSVVVHPMAPGQITEVTFQEGQEVKKGDVLARIDPSLYSAQLAQAMANKEQDVAQAEATRYQIRQLGKGQGAKQQALLASLHQFEAAIKSDDAAIQQARALLIYTTVTAPVDGRLGIRRVDAGNIIQPGDKDGLVEITQMDPVSVAFTVPEQNLPAIAALIAQAKPLTVTASDIASGEVLAQGELEIADNQVNPASGALRMKASFSNPARKLWPGAMVQVQMSLGTMPDTLVIPASALVTRGQQHYVYKVDAAQKSVSLQPVRLLMTQGGDAAIEGLNPGDQLAVEATTALASNSAINPLGTLAPAR